MVKSAPQPTIDDFLANVPEDQRAALQRLRETIRAAAPDATEVINYGVPMFKLAGANLVSFSAGKNHCSFHVQSPDVMEAHAAGLAGYDTAKGTIRFKADEALPADLVTKLVKARIEENERIATERKAKKR